MTSFFLLEILQLDLSHRLPAARETEVKVKLCMAGKLQRCAVTTYSCCAKYVYWYCLTTTGRVAMYERCGAETSKNRYYSLSSFPFHRTSCTTLLTTYKEVHPFRLSHISLNILLIVGWAVSYELVQDPAGRLELFAV